MRAGHLQGRLTAFGREIYAADGSRIAEDITTEAKARRLVACWNACEGVPTLMLESEVHQRPRLMGRQPLGVGSRVQAGARGCSMRIDDTVQVKAFTIYEAMRAPGRGKLDPITVMLRDFGGSGQIVVECYGDAWAHYFGAIGSETIRQFIAGCDEHYLSGKLISYTWRKPTKAEEAYLLDIARAVIAALKGGAA